MSFKEDFQELDKSNFYSFMKSYQNHEALVADLLEVKFHFERLAKFGMGLDPKEMAELDAAIKAANNPRALLMLKVEDLIAQATNERSHFYTASVLKEVRDYLMQPTKCWVTLGLMGGIPSHDPEIFFDEAKADARSAEIDTELNIERGTDGRYDSDNDSFEYEVEIK